MTVSTSHGSSCRLCIPEAGPTGVGQPGYTVSVAMMRGPCLSTCDWTALRAHA